MDQQQRIYIVQNFPKLIFPLKPRQSYTVYYVMMKNDENKKQKKDCELFQIKRNTL